MCHCRLKTTHTMPKSHSSLPIFDHDPLHRDLPVSHNQCEQIWRNFSTLAKSFKSFAIFGGLI